jgi:integrase
VSRSVEEVDGQFRFKSPKTDRSHRCVKLPAALIEELRRHRKEQAEMRLRLGLGRDEDDLVFTTPDGSMLYPNYITEAFAREVGRTEIKKRVRFHSLRHSHLSVLLKAGVPVHAVAARAGHARPSTTLNTYSHLLGGEDDLAADVTEKVLKRSLK